MQSHTAIYVPGIRISCCCICTRSMCVFNHGYITYRKLSLHQEPPRYLLVGPTTLLKPLILDLPNYLTSLPVFQKNWALSFSVTVEENGKLNISYLIFCFSLPWTHFIFYSWPLLLVRKKLFHDFAKKSENYLLNIFSIPVFFHLPNKHFCIDMDK